MNFPYLGRTGRLLWVMYSIFGEVEGWDLAPELMYGPMANWTAISGCTSYIVYEYHVHCTMFN